MKNDLKKITEFILESQNVDLSKYDESFLKKMIGNRISSRVLKSAGDYCDLLKSDKNEITVLLNSLNISFSEFFRNPLTFAYLEQVIIPAMIEKKKKSGEREIRIWSAACAAGEEAYSLAILFDEFIEKSNGVSCRIFATDICESELENAKTGVYQTASLNKVTLKRIQKYFIKQGEIYTISKQLSKYIEFSVFDLLSEHGFCPPESIYGNFDIVFCSNILFYYKPECRKLILEKAGHCIADDGYLITGESERDIVTKHQYHEIFPASAIFQCDSFKE